MLTGNENFEERSNLEEGWMDRPVYDYLVEKLVANGIMPVMRLYRPGVLAYDGNIYAMVKHYRAKGVYYYQLYNEPNVNVENQQGFANPNQYAQAWAAAAVNTTIMSFWIGRCGR